MNGVSLSLLCMLLAASASGGEATASDTTSDSETGARAKAQRSESELEALRAELRRGVENLRVEGQAKPYEAELRMVRVRTLTVDASYGGILTDLQEDQGFATVELRVGSSEQDNGNFYGANLAPSFVLPLQPNATLARKGLWLAMDAAYRAASSSYVAKEAARARLASGPETLDRGAAPPPGSHLLWATGGDAWNDPPEIARGGIDRQKRALFREWVKTLSSRFEAHPDIDNGDVIFQVMHSQETVLGRGVDGWELGIGDEKVRVVLAVLADTQAEDGMKLDHGGAMHWRGVPELNDGLRAEGEAWVDRLLGELDAMVKAPRIDEDYDGPILLSSLASAQLLASSVATHASGEPPPLSEYGPITELTPHWQARLGKRVMPDFIDLYDEPSAEVDPFGAYTIDAEGFRPSALQIVREGVLSDLLMTRTPNTDIETSNGRARMSPSLIAGASVSNLRLSGRREGKERAALERELLQRAGEDGYDFAYVIESLRDGTVLGPVPREGAADYGNGHKVSLPIPARIYRLNADGSRELVRGALLSPISMRVLRRIRSLGKQAERHGFRLAPGVSGGFNADLGVGGILSQTVDVTVRTPALLIDGMELLVERGEAERLPLLVHPLRDGKKEGTKEGARSSLAPAGSRLHRR